MLWRERDSFFCVQVRVESGLAEVSVLDGDSGFRFAAGPVQDMVTAPSRGSRSLSLSSGNESQTAAAVPLPPPQVLQAPGGRLWGLTVAAGEEEEVAFAPATPDARFCH